MLVEDNELDVVIVLDHDKGAISLNTLNSWPHFDDMNLVSLALVENEILPILHEYKVHPPRGEEYHQIRIRVISVRGHSSLLGDKLV